MGRTGLILLVVAALTRTGIPKWSPSINFTVTNQVVRVVVKEAYPGAAYHKLCISRNNVPSCLGNVTYIPSKDTLVVFAVTGLPQNVNLTIFVQPYDEANNNLDIWVHSRKKIVIPPSLPETSTTEAVTQMYTSTEPPNGQWVYVVVGLVLVLVLGAAILMVYAGIHRGFFGRLKVFHCNNCMVPGSGSPIKILHLYVPENPEFDNFVRSHIAFLKVCANIKTVEASQIWNQDFQLESVFASHRVLIYISPSLAQALCDEGGESALPHSYLTVTRLVLRSLQQNASAQHRDDNWNLPIIVVSGCFPSDADDEVRLRNLRVVPCHWVSRQYGSSTDLKHPADLLHDIGSQQRSTCFDPLRSECWRTKPEATSLRHALRDLRAAFERHTTRVMIRENDQLLYLSDTTHSENLSLCANPALQSVDQMTTQMLKNYVDPYFDQIPQQPDSGHSSSFTGMGSDPDLSHNSPGERAGRSRAEDASETETDSLICMYPDQDMESLRRSHPFFAPDEYTSIDGSQTNIDNILMNLNKKSEGDWSQNRHSHDFI